MPLSEACLQSRHCLRAQCKRRGSLRGAQGTRRLPRLRHIACSLGEAKSEGQCVGFIWVSVQHVPIQQSRWTSRECTVAERPLRSTRVTRRTMMTLAPTAMHTLFIFLARFDKGAVRCASKCSSAIQPSAGGRCLRVRHHCFCAFPRGRSTGLGVAGFAIRSRRGRHRPRASPRSPNGPIRARMKPPDSPAATRSKRPGPPIEKKSVSGY